MNATGTITVTENNTAGTIAGDESGCSGFDPATIHLTPTGGSGSITYLWEYQFIIRSLTTIAPFWKFSDYSSRVYFSNSDDTFYETTTSANIRMEKVLHLERLTQV